MTAIKFSQLATTKLGQFAIGIIPTAVLGVIGYYLLRFLGWVGITIVGTPPPHPVIEWVVAPMFGALCIAASIGSLVGIGYTTFFVGRWLTHKVLKLTD